jgi:hypothetical protein
MEDLFGKALKEAAKEKSIKERLELSPADLAVAEELGMAGMGSIEDIPKFDKAGFI